jgi:hypothetical protein
LRAEYFGGPFGGPPLAPPADGNPPYLLENHEKWPNYSPIKNTRAREFRPQGLRRHDTAGQLIIAKKINFLSF